MAMFRWLDLRHATRGWFTLPHGCSRRGLRLRVTPRKENKGFARYLGGLFRSLFHHVANSVRERSLEHCTLGLQASKLHTHEFGPVGT